MESIHYLQSVVFIFCLDFQQWDKRIWTCVSVMDKQEWKGFYELLGQLVPWYHTVSTSKVNLKVSLLLLFEPLASSKQCSTVSGIDIPWAFGNFGVIFGCQNDWGGL